MNARAPYLAAAVCLVTLTGCNPWRKKPVAVMRPPDAALDVAQFSGTALSGPQAKPVDAAAIAAAWGVRARILTTEKMPGDPFIFVGPQARLVIGQNPADVLAPTSRLTNTTRALWLKTDDALEPYLDANGQWQELRTLRGAVAVGSTAAFDVAVPEATEKSATYSRRRLRIEVSRSAAGDAYELALRSDELTQPDLIPSQEKIVFSRSLAGDADRVAMAVPMAFPDSSARAVVVDLLVTRSADPQQIEAAKTQIAASAAGVEKRMNTAPATPEESAIAAALQSINTRPANRGSLAFLADETGAALTKNVVLAADDALLPMITAEVRTRSQNLPKTDKNTVGWMLDRATIATLAGVKEDDAPKLLPAAQGALIAYAGEVGRQLDLLQSLAAQSVNSRDLDAHIIAEHRINLEDTSPALRVRAYDWLADRGQAPKDYDPFASARARRAAIDKYNEAATRPATQPEAEQP